MIEKIYIENFIIIDRLEIDFFKGLSCFTGETGAGKSIIVDAIDYLTGGRIDKHVHKDKNKRCFLEAYFTLDDEIKIILNSASIDFDDYLVISRFISIDNKSIVKVNGVTVTLSFLRSIFESKIDIHSQKENQYLLKEQNQLRVIDSFITDCNIFVDVEASYHHLRNLKSKKAELLQHQFNEREFFYWQQEIDEIEGSSISSEEEEDLLTKEKIYKEYQKFAGKIKDSIYLYEKEEGIEELLSKSLSSLETISSDEISSIHQQINDYFYQLQDQYKILNNYLVSISDGEIDIDYVQERLFLYARLKRKYGPSVEAILLYLEQIKEKVKLYQDRDSFMHEIDSEISSAEQEYLNHANLLQKKRIEIAKHIEKEVLQNLCELELPNAQFAILFSTCKETKLGIDSVQFFVSLNKGKDLDLIAKVASGGELSRILLALKCVFSKQFKISTVIFDEIDVGVSGKASKAIGLKMAELSHYTQVFSITHSAQVAAFANYHYLVSKEHQDNGTISSIRMIEGEDNIYQLASIQSASVNKDALKAAETMYKEAQSYYANK